MARYVLQNKPKPSEYNIGDTIETSCNGNKYVVQLSKADKKYLKKVSDYADAIMPEDEQQPQVEQPPLDAEHPLDEQPPLVEPPTEFIHFWHCENKPYGLLSNWADTPFLAPVGDKMVKFYNSEQYFIYRKALLFDESKIPEILATKSPKQVKYIGKHKIKNFVERIWKENRKNVMKDAIRYKFQNPELQELLLSTGNKIICEASPLDKIWGIGLGAKSPNANNPDKWKGLNLLGICLMEIRDELRASKEAEITSRND